MVAVGAIASLGSLLGASGGYGYVPVAVGVTQRIDISVGVGVAAGGTGVGGEALGGAGGGSYDGLILMTKSLDLAGLGVVALGAVALFLARLGAGGFHSHIPIAVGVTRGVDRTVNVSVTAGAGVGGVTLGGAGGRRDGGLVLVT